VRREGQIQVAQKKKKKANTGDYQEFQVVAGITLRREETTVVWQKKMEIFKARKAYRVCCDGKHGKQEKKMKNESNP